MSDATTVAELFRSLGLSLTVSSHPEEDEAWACTLTRADGETFEIDMVSFFDVDPETGEEWITEPTPSRVLAVLAGGDDVSDEEDEDGEGADADAEQAAREFLGDEAYDQLLVLLAEGEDEE